MDFLAHFLQHQNYRIAPPKQTVKNSLFLLFSEHFFGNVRGSLGANNNPNCAQFMAVFKRLLVMSEIRGRNGSCQDFGLVKPLVHELVSRKKRCLPEPQNEMEDEVLLYQDKLYALL